MSDNQNTELDETPEVIDAEPQHAHDEEELKFQEEPQFVVEYKGECAYEVKCTIAAVNEKAQAGEMLDELQDDAQIPGFRRGRAPRRLIENKFSKVIRGEAVQKLISAAFKKMVAAEKLTPIHLPDVDGLENLKDRDADQPIECTFKFEVTPRCELGQYRGIQVERPVLKVAAEDVDRVLESMRDRFSVYESSADGAAAEGDQVIIDFKGEIDGKEFAGGSAEAYPYILGSKRFFQQFEEALQGATTGADLTCDVPFPAEYSNADLAGKTAQFTIKVQEIKRKKLPALDDDFAKQTGEEDLAALRTRVEGELRDRAGEQSRNAAESNALKTIVETSTFELPKSMVASSAEEYYQQEVRRLASMRVPAAIIAEGEADIRKGAEETAIRGIKTFFALREIGEAEGIEVTDADFEKEAEEIQGRTGADMEVVSRYLRTAERQDEYADRIYRRKALAVIMETATFIDKEVTPEEMEQEDGQEDA